jgi:hypothetical protein
MKRKQTMNSQTQRIRDPAEGEVIAPLCGPSYGAYNVIKRKWRKPLPAVIADALANSQALLARLERGMFAPDFEREVYYKAMFDELHQRTRDQIKTLQKFSQIVWSER